MLFQIVRDSGSMKIIFNSHTRIKTKTILANSIMEEIIWGQTDYMPWQRGLTAVIVAAKCGWRPSYLCLISLHCLDLHPYSGFISQICSLWPTINLREIRKTHSLCVYMSPCNDWMFFPHPLPPLSFLFSSSMLLFSNWNQGNDWARKKNVLSIDN